VWSAALREIDPRTGLMACAENAADDPAPAPFIAGSQVMLWYAARRLRELAAAGALAIDVDALDALADGVRAAFDRELADGNNGWAYATDGRGRRVAYHDANDLPTALAPLWGFCPPGDPGWAATMAWAFSSANPGYAAGTRGGLGSTHTPGPWTLGDIQAWIRARAAGDESGMRAALERLRAVAFDDGMLPEAYSAAPDPDVRVRHWFAWPGAALGALLLLDARGELETRLRA
jgi:meiotically up-regulated gene 157 (Mug157) protein